MGVKPAQHHKCGICFSSVAGNFVMKRMNLKNNRHKLVWKGSFYLMYKITNLPRQQDSSELLHFEIGSNLLPEIVGFGP